MSIWLCRSPVTNTLLKQNPHKSSVLSHSFRQARRGERTNGFGVIVNPFFQYVTNPMVEVYGFELVAHFGFD
jgi:hypothetical protein